MLYKPKPKRIETNKFREFQSNWKGRMATGCFLKKKIIIYLEDHILFYGRVTPSGHELRLNDNWVAPTTDGYGRGIIKYKRCWGTLHNVALEVPNWVMHEDSDDDRPLRYYCVSKVNNRLVTLYDIDDTKNHISVSTPSFCDINLRMVIKAMNDYCGHLCIDDYFASI